MSTEELVQNMISELGQSQDERPAAEIADHFVDVDERTPDDQLRLAHELAANVRFYQTDGSSKRSGTMLDWTPFFRADASTRIADGSTPPHLALFRAFLDMREAQRGMINGVTLRHLDFHQEQVLGFAPRAPVPDRAHVLFELKKGSQPTRIGTDVVLSAGKDPTGAPLSYQPVRETVVCGAAVDTLSTVLVDDKAYAAPVAASGDGVGGALAAGQLGWPSFGASAMPAGSLGFALSSPVLRMAEGKRTVTVTLDLGAGAASALAGGLLDGALQAFFTGPKSWLGPFAVVASSAGGVLTLTISIDAGSPAIVDYDPALHGGAFAADGPVVELLLAPADAPVGAPPPSPPPSGYGKHNTVYGALAGLSVASARIFVDVDEITTLTLENDGGTLDPKKAFMPFGALPVKGSRFRVGCPEALSKPLTGLKLSVRWQGLPDSFTSNYQGYLNNDIDASYFTATVTFMDGTGEMQTRGARPLFDGSVADVDIDLAPGGGGGLTLLSPAHRVYALGTAGSVVARHVAEGRTRIAPVLRAFLGAKPDSPSGVITLALDRGFLQDVFRRKTIENAINHTSGSTFTLLADPVVPVIERISLSYQAATSEVPIGKSDEASFANPDLRFFHVDTFGQRREHAYLRGALDYVGDKAVPLFPPHAAGELYVGLTNLGAGDSVSVLFQVVDGTADPDVVWPALTWSVLGDNQWKALGPGDVALDTTRALRGSGLVAFVIPPEASTATTLLPSGRVWLKAAVAASAEAMPQLALVAANAVEVAFVDEKNDPAHLASALPAGSIAKLGTPVASVKSVGQPYASFGGRPLESAEARRTRASERLRHKDRCITPWDYERIVLEAFPAIHRVKCIPHARKDAWFSPGHVLLVVVPDLRRKNGRDLLRPRVDPDTLDAIAEYATARAGLFSTGTSGGERPVTAHNPSFQRIRLDFKVKLKAGQAFNVALPQLRQEITAFLSPWAYDAEREIVFGGRIYRSVLLDFVMGRSYVDYVTDFKMYSYTDSRAGAPDVAEAAPERPDAILVSDDTHDITLIPS